MKLYRKNRKLNNSGFSLVEVLVAIVILAIISLPVLSTFSNAARINNKARRTENANTAMDNILISSLVGLTAQHILWVIRKMLLIFFIMRV